MTVVGNRPRPLHRESASVWGNLSPAGTGNLALVEFGGTLELSGHDRLAERRLGEAGQQEKAGYHDAGGASLRSVMAIVCSVWGSMEE